MIQNETALQQIAALRLQSDEIDRQLVEVLSQRFAVTAQIGEIKRRVGLPIFVPEREQQVLQARKEQAEEIGLDPGVVVDIFQLIMVYSKKHQ
jgi:chorismate mutase/prephenate dehydrogenase